jgi:hypothetical protein
MVGELHSFMLLVRGTSYAVVFGVFLLNSTTKAMTTAYLPTPTMLSQIVKKASVPQANLEVEYET